MTRNIYGCTPCTECYGEYRYPIKIADLYHIQCDDCGHMVPAKRVGDYDWDEIVRCPHDDHECKHECNGGECWRELNGS